MLKINGTKVVPESAEYFRAFGNEWGVRVQMSSGGTWILGTVKTYGEATELVHWLNDLEDGKYTTKEVMSLQFRARAA